MAAPGVLVAAAGSGLGCDKDEEYCPGLEPFFFDEAEAVAGHERWMRREQERAQKEEQRVRAANANISAREKILDDDPKQDGRYFNRFYLADFSTFDIDEESPLPPMRYTDRVCDNNKRWKIGGVNILSVNIASLDVDFPIDVYGTVIARDGVDYKCIYLFRREKEHCQLIKSEDESLILTGPKRGLELLGDAFIEIDLKINDHLGQEEKQLSKGLLTIRGIAGRNMDKCIVESKDLSTRLSTVKVMYAIVNDAVEATIAIEVIEGEFYGKITAITTGVPNHLVLHDSEVAGVMNGNGKGVIQLLRSVVSVSLEGCLLLTFVDQTGNLKSLGLTPGLNGRVERRPAQPPATWIEAVGTLAETLRFTYSETLGKWPIGDLAFGIKYLMRRQGNIHVASVYAGSDCIELKGPEIMEELIVLRRLIDLCFLFSKKPFPVFRELAGFSQEDVLIEEPKAGILKPAHTILRDECTKSFLVLIRGTHSMKDTLTAATGAVVPFHLSLLDEGGVSKLVLGYAHCGMVAAARWIARSVAPCLREAVRQYPEYQIKIVGHSLGGGTAALLTYILREHTEFSSTTCVAFAPASCMTWELAESGKHFVTTIVNGADLVPTVSTASIDDLRSEVTASSWLNDLRDQIQQTRFLNVVYRSATALGTRLQSFSGARERVAGAGAFLRPVSSKTQVVMKQAQNVAQAVARSRSAFSSWSCMGARRRGVGVVTASSKDDMTTETHVTSTVESESFIVDQHGTKTIEELQYTAASVSVHEEADEEEALLSENETSQEHAEEEITEGELWYEFEKDMDRQVEVEARTREEEAAAAKEIMEEESAVLKNVEDRQSFSSDSLEGQQFYPPGRIMHMVAMPPTDADPDDPVAADECSVGIYETPRDLYSKIRLSNTMINDHYMPMYKKTMEILIEKFAKDEDNSCTGSTEQ